MGVDDDSFQNMPTEPEIIPRFVTIALLEIDRLLKFGRMTDLGFTLGGRLSAIANIFGSRFEEDSLRDGVAAVFRTYADELEEYARRETSADMPYLRSLIVVRLVTILEGVVDDAVLASLQMSSVLAREEIRRLKGPLVEFFTLDAPERAEYLAELLAQDLRATVKSGVWRFEAVLNAVGLSGEIHSAVKKTLLELLQIRNVIVHKNGRADRKFVDQCPWLHVKTGEEIALTGAMVERYRAASIYYLTEIVIRWIRRAGHAGLTSPFEMTKQNALARLWIRRRKPADFGEAAPPATDRG